LNIIILNLGLTLGYFPAGFVSYLFLCCWYPYPWWMWDLRLFSF
jgi:hypothetical protein